MNVTGVVGQDILDVIVPWVVSETMVGVDHPPEGQGTVDQGQEATGDLVSLLDI